MNTIKMNKIMAKSLLLGLFINPICVQMTSAQVLAPPAPEPSQTSAISTTLSDQKPWIKTKGLMERAQARLQLPYKVAEPSIVPSLDFIKKDLSRTVDMNNVAAKTQAPPKPTSPAQSEAPPQPSCATNYGPAMQSAYEALGPVNAAFEKNDLPAAIVQIPRLEAVLNSLPLRKIGPNVCPEVIHVYDQTTYFELNLLRANKIDIGLPSQLPLLKMPDLPFADVAGTLAILRSANQDPSGSSLAFAKGLVLEPTNADLAAGYMMSLIELKRYAEALGFADKFISNNHNIDDAHRSAIFKISGLSLIFLGDFATARQAVIISLAYNPSDEDARNLYNSLESQGKPKPNS